VTILRTKNVPSRLAEPQEDLNLSLSGRFSTSLWWANRVRYGPESLGPYFRYQPISQNEIMGLHLPSLVVTCRLEVSCWQNIYENAFYLSVHIQFWHTSALCALQSVPFCAHSDFTPFPWLKDKYLRCSYTSEVLLSEKSQTEYNGW
jgi:hypothetical protein